MTLDLVFFAAAVPAVLFAAVSKAGFGSGAGFAAAAILALVLPPALALGLMLPLLLLVDLASLRPYWRRWHGPSAVWLTLGGVPGVALGAWLITVVPADAFRVLIGAICLLFVGFQIGQTRGWIAVGRMPFRRDLALATGLVGGFTSFISHAGGPALAVFLLGQGLSKTAYQATTVIVFFVVNILKLGAYLGLGLISPGALPAILILTPVALAGTWLGVRAHRWMPERAFFALTYVLLTATGLRLIWVGLR